MGALTVIRENSGEDSLSKRLEAVLQSQGFDSPLRRTAGGYTILVSPKMVAPVDNHLATEDGCFIATAGTLFYREKHGNPALAQLLDDARADNIDEDACIGSFAVLICIHGELRLFTDRLGMAKLYCTEDGRVWSTSFLTCLTALDTRRFNPQGVYEYVFQGTAYGPDTIIIGIGQVAPDHVYILAPERRTITRPWPFEPRHTAGTLDDHVARHVETLRHVYGTITASYGNRIDTALSGGYDSRLSLALLRDRGVMPALHVYGGDTDPDVAVARRVAEGEGLPLKHIDKSRMLTERDPETVAEAVARQFWAFDGWPTDGIIGTGSDLSTRKARVADGALALNGGGGEVFRNFFYLRDREFTAREVLWVFYSRFDPRTTTDAFSETGYLDRLEEKLRGIFPDPGRRLSRTAVEFVYPGFRGRFWTGRNTWLNNRFGPALMPFFEVPVVRNALAVPLTYKNHGRFEAALINRIAPKLAAYPSVYGHDFAHSPGLRHRLEDWRAYLRPPRLRRLSYRFKNRLQSSETPKEMSDEYRRYYLPEGTSVMDRFFKIAAVRDPEQRARILTLEYLARQMEVSP